MKVEVKLAWRILRQASNDPDDDSKQSRPISDSSRWQSARRVRFRPHSGGVTPDTSRCNERHPESR